MPAALNACKVMAWTWQHNTVAEVVDDLEATRLALGYEKINLYSISYGTRLAMSYAWRYLGSVHRSAMFAVNQPEALEYLFTNYYATGVADDSLYVYQPVDFHVGFGYPEQAKLAVGAMVLIPIGLVALVWIIVRRIRRRRTV